MTSRAFSSIIGNGFLPAVLATLLWSSAFVSARYLLGGTPQRIDPMSLVCYRFLIGAGVIFAIARLRGEPLKLHSIREAVETILVALLLYFLMSFLFFLGQPSVSATTSALFIESGPGLIVIACNLLRGRKPTRTAIVAIGLGVLGCMLVLNIITVNGIHYDFTSLAGQLFLLAAAISWVAGSVRGQQLMRRSNWLPLTGWSQLIAAGMMLPWMGIFHDQLIFPREFGAWNAVVVMGIFPSALAFIAWSYAMPRMELWKLSLIQNLTPVFTLAGAWLLLGEQLSALNFLGVALVLSAVAITVLPQKQP